MSFTNVTQLINPTVTSKQFTLVPAAAGDFILIGILCSATTTSWATALSSASGQVNWSALGTHLVSASGNNATAAYFLGQVVTASSHVVTITTNTGSPTMRCGGSEFSNTSGFSALTLDNSGTVDVSTSGHMPGVSPTRAGDLYWSYCWDNGTGVAGTTSGYTYKIDANGNILCYNTNCANATQTPNIGDTATDGTTGIGFMFYEAATAVTSTGAVAFTPAVSGTGIVTDVSTAAVTFGPVTSGTVDIANPITSFGSVNFSPAVAGNAYQPITSTGAVSLNLATAGTVFQPVTSSGAVSFSPAVSGNAFETVTASGAVSFSPSVTAFGTTSVGRLAGAAQFTISYAPYPGTSQVSVAPPGSSTWQYMGSIGQMTALNYSYQCPGGCYQAAWTLMAPSTYRDQRFNPGNKVRITRGGHQIWSGKLDEPVSSPSGWSFTATGDGTRGSDFVAYYTSTWPNSQPDQSINNAISRGMPWVNPGVGSPSGIWLGQEVDPAAQFISDLLNLVCTRGGLTWYVNSQPGGPIGSSLSVFPLPTTVNRLIVCTQPIPRTLGGYINTLFIRYNTATDSSTAATYATTTVQNTQSANVHGVIEDYIDLSDAGVSSAAQAQAVGNYILQIYQAASFAGPFTVNYGQLLTTGGQPIDPGTDQAGTVAQVIATDYGYGGEVTPQFPITFPVGTYEWDDFAQVATITPFQALDQSISGLLSMENTVLTPITAAGG